LKYREQFLEVFLHPLAYSIRLRVCFYIALSFKFHAYLCINSRSILKTAVIFALVNGFYGSKTELLNIAAQELINLLFA
jgi:hypothetical protein